ncbi:MAG: hypothetical protein FWG42_00360 [Clostridiales bacterium]|nr:hypothetical protein [Clostridiales bacterium]
MERILSRKEFGGQSYDPIGDSVAMSAMNSLPRIMDSISGFGLAVMVVLVAALVFCLARLVFLERRRRFSDRSRPLPAGQTAAEDPFAHAEELARVKDWAGALLALYSLHLHTLHNQGWILWDESKTGMQYKWELVGNRYGDVEGFDAFRRVFNRVRFGGYSELRETYEAFLAYCRKRPERRQAA